MLMIIFVYILLQVFDLKDDSQENENSYGEQSDWSIQEYQNKLQEMAVMRQVTEAEVEELKEKVHEQQYTIA